MTRMLHLIGMVTLVATFSGCISQEKYNALKLDRDGLAEQLGKAQNDASTSRAEAESYKQQLAAIINQGGGLQGLVANLQQQNSNLQAALDEINRKYADAINRGGLGSPLPPALTNELSAFASQFPELVDFDAARGMVKFKSDVTFAPGDATLQPSAKNAINTFARILNSPTASGYELLIAGHTDSTRVVNPRTISSGHKNNWYLSAHRAITVGEELMGQGTNSQRIGVVGYADQRPAAPNSTEAGKAQNRRVEVLILPTTVRSGNFASTPSRSTPAPGAPLNKDTSANTPTGSILNK